MSAGRETSAKQGEQREQGARSSTEPDTSSTVPASLDELLERWVHSAEFSCLAARGAFRRGTAERHELPRLADPGHARQLHALLTEFVAERLSEQENFATLVVVFREPRGVGEQEFEQLLWRQLQQLHAVDRTQFPWAGAVSADPRSRTFGFSVARHPFFVVGMHDNASRASRRFAYPAMAFNSHRQFDRLKASGVYYRLRDRIRERELKLQGSINPNLADFGEASEARQYAGNAVPPSWQCPFRSSTGPDVTETRGNTVRPGQSEPAVGAPWPERQERKG